MMGAYGHVHPEFRHVVDLSEKERIAFLDMPAWVGYARAEQIMRVLQGLIRRPIQAHMPNLLIVGGPKNGKTTLIRRFFEICGKGYMNEEELRAIKPVIIAEAPPSASEKGLYISMLEQFFPPVCVADSCVKLRYQVVNQFRNRSVRMLVIDEFHSLLKTNPTKQREIMDAIKLLSGELSISIVGIGTREAVHALNVDPQYASQFDVFSVSEWNLDAEFQELLAGFERILPLRQPSCLCESEMALLLYSACGGNIGNLHKILVACAVDAIRNGKERIDKQGLESTVGRFSGSYD